MRIVEGISLSCLTCSKGLKFYATELAKGTVEQVINIVGNIQTIPGAVYAIKITPKEPIPRDKFDKVREVLLGLPEVKVIDVLVSENEIQVIFEGSPISLAAIIAALPGLLMLVGIVIVFIVLLLIIIREPGLVLWGLLGLTLFGIGYAMFKKKIPLPKTAMPAILPREIVERELIERGFIT